MPLDVNALFLDDLDLLMSDEDDGGEEVDEVSMELELPPHKRSSVKAPPPPHDKPVKRLIVEAGKHSSRSAGNTNVHALTRVRKRNDNLTKAIAFLTQTLNKNSAIVANQEQRWKEVLDNMHNEYQKELTQKDEEFREMSERVNELIQVETQKFAMEREAITITLRDQMEKMQAEKDDALAAVEQRLDRLSRHNVVQQTSSQRMDIDCSASVRNHDNEESALVDFTYSRSQSIHNHTEEPTTSSSNVKSSHIERGKQSIHQPVQMTRAIDNRRYQRGVSSRITLQVADNSEMNSLPLEVNPSLEGNIHDEDITLDSHNLANAVAAGVRAALQEFPSVLNITSTSSLGNSRRRISDEKITLTEEKRREPKVLRLKFLETTREIVKEVLGLDNDEDITSHDPPPPPVICLFETNYESGPELDDLRLDMKGKLLSEWNQAVARLLTDEFKNQQKCHGLPERSDAYMKDIFLEKIKRLRTIWRDAQPHTNLDGSVETVEDLETRLFRKKVTVTTSARRNTRRENKYNWRIRTVTTTLQLKEAENASDIKIWAWLRVMLQHLGPEGMSSEDTCTEGLETVYRVKILNWRHNIENELSIIDRQRILDADIFSPRGSKPAKRLRSDGNPVSTRKPVKKLPRALYDDAWYQLKPKEYRELTLCVSKEQFERIGNITALVQS